MRGPFSTPITPLPGSFFHADPHPVVEVSQRLSVSPHSLYAWKKRFAKVASGDASKDAEIRQLKRELARVTEERGILRKATAYFARMANEIRLRRRASEPVWCPRDVPVSRGAQEDARQDVFDYIETFYNPIRKHGRNGMLSPVEFERQQALMAQGV